MKKRKSIVVFLSYPDQIFKPDDIETPQAAATEAYIQTRFAQSEADEHKHRHVGQVDETVQSCAQQAQSCSNTQRNSQRELLS